MTPFPQQATTILVVDDERLPRRLASRLLTEEGYRVLEADDASEALNVLSQMRGRIDLLVLDVVMPGCDGVEFGRQVTEHWPDQRILYVSGYPAEVVRHGCLSSMCHSSQSPTRAIRRWPKCERRWSAGQGTRNAAQ